MSGKDFSEVHKLILFVQKTPFTEEEKKKLVDLLNANGMTEENADLVHKALADLPKEKFTDDWQRAKFLMDLNSIVKQWQLSHGSKNFKHNR